MKKLIWAAAAAMVFTTSAHASGGNAGKEKSRPCAACHGVDGNSAAPDFPRLAGQHASYIAKSLKEYRSGARKNPIMGPQAEKLTDRDIADLAAYFSSQQGLAAKR
jgi:cytochrome c553